ncbi:unnamed protein product, partial [Laminaria digitata]
GGDGGNYAEIGSDTEEGQERVLRRVREYLFALENATCRAELPVQEVDTSGGSAATIMNGETFLYLHETEVGLNSLVAALGVRATSEGVASVMRSCAGLLRA